MLNTKDSIGIDDLKFLIEETVSKRLEILEKKGKDYSGDDQFSAFKTLSKLCQTFKIDVFSPEGILVFLVIFKLRRYCNLRFNNNVPVNESVVDTLMDLQNYLDLLMVYEKIKGVNDRHERVVDGDFVDIDIGSVC